MVRTIKRRGKTYRYYKKTFMPLEAQVIAEELRKKGWNVVITTEPISRGGIDYSLIWRRRKKGRRR